MSASLVGSEMCIRDSRGCRHLCKYLSTPVLQIRSVIRVITLITLLCCFDEEGYSLYSKKDILCVRRRTFFVFEEGQPLCSTNEIPYVRGRTFCVFEAERSVCSKQEVPCVRNRTFLVIEAGHSLCSKQDIPCVRSRTFLVFQAGGNVLARKIVLAPNMSILPLKIRHFSSSIF